MNTRPIIAVYAIALNEEKFVERFYQSCKDADYIIVGDTGSTDKTVEKLRDLGVQVYDIRIRPWRFDTARNIVLGLIPEDVDLCISIDMDEILVSGWRKHLEIAWTSANPKPSSISYKYVWSWNADGTPAVYFKTEKIHARFGYNWRYPCHEALSWLGETVETRVFSNLEIHHHPDPTKSRGHYLDILKMGVRENAWSGRPAYYYARELFFVGKYDLALQEFARYLNLPDANYKHERAAARVFQGQCAINLGKHFDECLWYFTQSIEQEVPTANAYMQIAKLSYNNQRWDILFSSAAKAVALKDDMAFSSCPEVKTSLPHDYMSIAAWHMGEYKDALIHVQDALHISPDDVRLQANESLFKSKLEK